MKSTARPATRFIHACCPNASNPKYSIMSPRNNTDETCLNKFDSNSEQTSICRRRRDVAKFVHSIWTHDGTDDSGLALPFFDGRIELLGLYLMDDPYTTIQDFETLYIHRVDPTTLSYQEFYRQYMSKNEPVLFTRGLTDRWPAARNWVTNNGKPNLEYLTQHFGNDPVTVHIQSTKGFDGSTCVRRETTNMTLEEYILWWQQQYETSSIEELQLPIYYLKDWKFVALHKDSTTAYTTPHYFCDDWLNDDVQQHPDSPTTTLHSSVQAMGDAYKFCYLGPSGSITPLHSDVLNSYSWSSNLCGCKKWWMIPPRHSYLLYDSFGKKIAPHMHSDLDMGDLGKTLYPGLEMARNYAISFLQNEGETVFVPSAWYHTVENRKDTLSINHNWINGTNIEWCWDKVRNESKNLKNIDDLYLLFLIIQRKAMGTINHHIHTDELHDLKKVKTILDDMIQYMLVTRGEEVDDKLTVDDVSSLQSQVDILIHNYSF